MKFSFRNIFGDRFVQYLAAITGTLGIISSEMHFGWPSPSLPVLKDGTYIFQLTSSEASWLAVIFLAGIIFGAILSGIIGDILGRKKMILLTCLPFFFSWIMIGLARSAVWLFIARFLAGIASGFSFATVPMYLGEISEPEIRGLISSLCPVFVVIGILLVNILGNYIPIQLTAYIASVLPIIMLLSFAWMPESPIFLLLKGRNDEAKKMLKILRGRENGEKEFDRLAVEMKEHSGEKADFFDLFRIRSNRKALFIALGLRAIQQFCGATALTFYCKTIFQETKDFLSPNTASTVYFSLQGILSILSSLIVDIFGRRPLILVSLAGTVVTLFITGTYLYAKSKYSFDVDYYNFIPISALFFNTIFFNLGCRNIPLLMMSEIFPCNIKSNALCFGTVYYSILGIVLTKLFYLTKDAVGMYCPFFVFGVFSFCGLFFIVFCVPETRGRTLEDIQKDLKEDNSFCSSALR